MPSRLSVRGSEGQEPDARLGRDNDFGQCAEKFAPSNPCLAQQIERGFPKIFLAPASATDCAVVLDTPTPLDAQRNEAFGVS